jgi:hypothetical protein
MLLLRSFHSLAITSRHSPSRKEGMR